MPSAKSSGSGRIVISMDELPDGINGVDYETLSGRAIIPSGSSSIDITIRPLPDDLAEGMETVILRLEPQPQYQLGIRSNAVALISESSWISPQNGVRYARAGDRC